MTYEEFLKRLDACRKVTEVAKLCFEYPQFAERYWNEEFKNLQSMKRFLINVIFIVIGLPFYLIALILIVYVAIMRFLFALIACSVEPYKWLDKLDTHFYETMKEYLPCTK